MSSSDFLLDFGVDISTFFVKLLYKDQLRPDTFHGKCKQILCKLFLYKYTNSLLMIGMELEGIWDVLTTKKYKILIYKKKMEIFVHWK